MVAAMGLRHRYSDGGKDMIPSSRSRAGSCTGSDDTGTALAGRATGISSHFGLWTYSDDTMFAKHTRRWIVTGLYTSEAGYIFVHSK